MTPDELVVMMLERLAKSKVDFTVDNYAATRAAAERLLRTVGAVPSEPPRQIEAATPTAPPMAPVVPMPTVRCDRCGATRSGYALKHCKCPPPRVDAPPPPPPPSPPAQIGSRPEPTTLDTGNNTQILPVVPPAPPVVYKPGRSGRVYPSRWSRKGR